MSDWHMELVICFYVHVYKNIECKAKSVNLIQSKNIDNVYRCFWYYIFQWTSEGSRIYYFVVSVRICTPITTE